MHKAKEKKKKKMKGETEELRFTLNFPLEMIHKVYHQQLNGTLYVHDSLNSL